MEHTPSMDGTCLKSLNRMVRLPIVESTVNTATAVYERIKKSNRLFSFAGDTAEAAATIALNVSRTIAFPVVSGLQTPIRQVDKVICSGLDYVEEKVPTVKLPPGQVIFSICDSTRRLVGPLLFTAYESLHVQDAVDILGPTYLRAKGALGSAGMSKTERKNENYWLCKHQHDEGVTCETCDECKEDMEQK